MSKVCSVETALTETKTCLRPEGIETESRLQTRIIVQYTVIDIR